MRIVFQGTALHMYNLVATTAKHCKAQAQTKHETCNKAVYAFVCMILVPEQGSTAQHITSHHSTAQLAGVHATDQKGVPSRL